MTMNQTTNNEDTIDLRELFFSLIVQWKLILLCVLLSIVLALLYLRVTSDTYSVDALVQVESPKGGASAALLGQELSNVMDTTGLGQQLAQAEIEILRSRLVVGTTIEKLNLDITVQPKNDSVIQRLISSSDFSTQYSSRGVLVENDSDHFDIQQFTVPEKYLNHFIRGVFDGDGSVFYYERVINEKKYIESGVSIISSNYFILELLNILMYQIAQLKDI